MTASGAPVPPPPAAPSPPASAWRERLSRIWSSAQFFLAVILTGGFATYLFLFPHGLGKQAEEPPRAKPVEIVEVLDARRIQIQPGSSLFGTPDNWQRILAVNLWGVIHGSRIFAPRMIERGRPGLIINTGSKQGITTPPGDPAYNVSKAGVKAFTEALQH